MTPPAMASPGMASPTTPAPIGTPSASGRDYSGATATPHPSVASPLANPDPYAEYNTRMTSPHGISTIHNPILRALAHIGDIAGSTFVPGVTAMIPGTTFNEGLANQKALAHGKVLAGENDEALKNKQTEATTEEAGARTDLAKAEAEEKRNPKPKPKEEKWDEFGKDQWVNGETNNPLLREENSGQVIDSITKQPVMHMKNIAPPKPENQEQNKRDFQAVVAKVDAAGLPTAPAQLPGSLNQALKSGKITADDHQKASGYLAANPTPSTNIQVQTAGAETKQAIHNANQWYRWKDPTSGEIVEGRGTKVPNGVEGDPIGDEKSYAQHQREGKISNAVQQSFNRLAEDIDKHPEIFDNMAARGIMATTLEQMDRTAAGFLVAGTGGSIPLPSGLGDTINAALQNHALDDKTARALKDYIADYRGMKDMAVVMQMEMQGGKIGRGSQQVFQAIINQLPNGSTPDSQTAKRLIQNFQQKQNVILGEHEDKGKEKVYEFKGQKNEGAGNQPPQGVEIPGGWNWTQRNGKWGITDGKQFRPYKGQ
jgi:hypothetical protein